MRIAYFDTFSGASGDMIVGSLLDAGLSLDDLRADLARLALSGYRVSAGVVRKSTIAATQFEVSIEHHAGHPHRSLASIRALFDESTLSDTVRDKALRVFERLAAAEAAVHGVSVEDIHFHEVGAVDSIVDVVGAAIGLERLGIERVFSGPLRFGTGTVRCHHGVLPIPAPATVRLAEGFPVEHTGIMGELTTPTGAAILTTFAECFGPPPPMRLERSGFGAGHADRPERPNVLRVLIGEEASAANADRVVVLEANIDDATAEVIGYTSRRLLAEGALDVFAVPIQMKKSRPGTLLSVIARPHDRERLEAVLFRETTTFGIRYREELRAKLSRRSIEVEVLGAKVRVKLGLLANEVVTASPEYEDCARIAYEQGVPLRKIYEAALQATKSSGYQSARDG